MTGPPYSKVLVRSFAFTNAGMPVATAARTRSPRKSSSPGRLESEAEEMTTRARSCDSSASGQSAASIACWTASAQETASKASWKATVNESPSVATSKPQYLFEF